MQNIIDTIKRDLPAILPAIAGIYAILAQYNVISPSNKFVSVVVAILSFLGISVLHVRQQVSLKK